MNPNDMEDYRYWRRKNTWRKRRAGLGWLALGVLLSWVVVYVAVQVVNNVLLLGGG